MAENKVVDDFEVLRVTGLEDNDYSRWMENLPNEKQLCPLKDLVIPGSHDSGTFFLDQNMEIGPDESSTIQTLGSIFGKIAKSVVHSWSVTQSMTIYEQLLSGIRYLDLRVAYRAEDNEIHILHGLYGWAIQRVLEEVNRFVANYPNEIVILDFNHFYNMDTATHETLADTLLASFSEIFRAPGEDGPNVTLQEMWGNEEKGHHNLSRLWRGRRLPLFLAAAFNLLSVAKHSRQEIADGVS
ncbi:PI-PLC X domain-containing protein 2 [Desmophyllum pertusum]|uniref:PI-PLC X domain-containing protein 2 n=1 Tax=Desmophyllum pertusum TaxID=174260 RepID=A0A9X0CW47_9CNID|nr:PI-PLC X domain-containing protein 2 [Desmophyllum pertusum]